LFWRDANKKNEKPRSLLFSEITDVLVGHYSTKVLTKNHVPTEFDDSVFSIVAQKRTLDLKAQDAKTRSKWERYFRLILVQRKEILTNVKNSKRNLEKEKFSEIWKIDILPHWETHWESWEFQLVS